MIIETRGLVKQYHHVVAVSGLDLAVPEGRISGFLGPGRVPLEEMDVPGVRKVRAEGHVLSLVADSNLNAITERAHALGALSIDAQPLSLLELFLESVEEEPS